MPSEFENIYYAVLKFGYIFINDNDYDYSEDTIVIELMKKYKKIIIGDAFNKSIDFLPEGITHLQLGQRFNKSIMNLPSSLTYLLISSYTIGYCYFNQSLDYLPEGLKYLTIKLNQVFNMPINNLPTSLKYLYINCNGFHQPINNLPNELESLVISCFDYKNTDHLPTKLKQVIIHNKLSNDEVEILNKNLVSTHPNIQFEIIQNI